MKTTSLIMLLLAALILSGCVAPAARHDAHVDNRIDHRDDRYDHRTDRRDYRQDRYY